MTKTPLLAHAPEAVLTAWLTNIKEKDVRPGRVIGQIIPGHQYVWENISARPSLARIDGIGITEASPSEYQEILKAIAQGQFQITAEDRLGAKTILHKATGLPLQKPARKVELGDAPSP